ncbi:MAG: MATE family efflux transporter [Blautia sp.]|nr:MATE family efflux transporter [Blautia sp.]
MEKRGEEILNNDNKTEKNQQFTKMTESNVSRLLVQLSIPAILSMLITTIYNVADTAFVGTLGTSQSGATGIVFSYMTIIQAIAFLCGQGSGSLMSRALGKKETRLAMEYTSTGFFLIFGMGLVLELLTFLFMDPLLRLLGSTETILPYARTYITFIAIGAPFYASSLAMNNLLRYEGKAKLGTVGMMAGALLNIGLDPLLMMVFKMGIAGAGLATAFSQIVSFCILLYMFLSGKTQTRISIKYWAHESSMVWDILATGSPSLIRQGLGGVSGMLLNRCAAVYGDAAVAAFSCVSRISFFALSIAIGIGQGFQPISSFNYGANKKDRVRKAFWIALTGEEIVIIVLSIPMFVFAPQLIRVLRDDVEVIEIGTRALRLLSACQLCMPLTMMVEMGFQSIGMKVEAIIGSSLRSGLLLIPSLLILSETRGLAGIQEAQPVSFVLSFVVAIFLCRIYMKKMR